MDETIIFPSPNWFQPSGIAVSNDGWLVYGGPSKSLCVLEPLPAENNGVVQEKQKYQAHVANRAHNEKIVSVDLCPEWPDKKFILTGAVDGSVKQWTLDKSEQSLKIKSTQSHEIHYNEKEEVAGIGYFNNGYAVTVGCYGQVVKWDLNSNVVKTFNHILRNFRPTCVACSPHLHLNVAIGTKQGIVFVLDLNGAARITYKVRGHDEEILKISWCPQYEVAVKKSLNESEKKSIATQRMEMIRQEPEDPEVLKELDERVRRSCLKEETVEYEITKEDELALDSNKEKENNVLEESGRGKTLPEDSFDETIVQEDDMFDIYKEPEDDEFGHKKYQPEDIIVKVTEDKNKEDYLDECVKLKEEILKRKSDTETSIESLVLALDKTHVGGNVELVKPLEGQTGSNIGGRIKKGSVESSVHIHKHLLASVGKYGSVRVWSKSGKLVGSCAVFGGASKNQRNQRERSTYNWTTTLWYKSDLLLIADGKSQLLECNPLQIDYKNKLEWKIIHSVHKRGLFSITTNAPRVQPPEMSSDKAHDDDWVVWTAAQDRNLVCYSVKKQQMLAEYNSCGGFLYMVQSCPYDAKRVAVSVGDGAIRVWNSDTTDEDDMKLSLGRVSTYWQNVQGKVLCLAWHPTRENWLAFGTAESRVGLLDVSPKTDKAAKVLLTALRGGVYALSWGEGNDLYAAASGELVVYSADKFTDAPTPLTVELEGQKWDVSAVRWYPQGMVVGSNVGAVAILEPNRSHQVCAAAFVYSKMIHTIAWHPQETANSEVSPYKNLIAVCSLDKVNTVVILEYDEKEDGAKQLLVWKTLSGHKNTVLQVEWNPHTAAQLLSTSQDNTVRIWNVAEGVCTAIFGGHTQTALGATWSAFPQFATKVISGGADCCLRLWDVADHPPEAYEVRKHEVTAKKEKKKKEKKDEKKEGEEVQEQSEDKGATLLEAKVKTSKKYLLPIIQKQTNPCSVLGPRAMLKKYLSKNFDNNQADAENLEYGLDYIKIFGSINEVNEVLDMELERHQDSGNLDAWMMLSVFRGHIDAMIQFASQRDFLDPYLLSLAPCVSFKYWKDATQLYLAQIDRLVAKGEESKLYESRSYGGPVYRKAATLLSLHDVKGAFNVLMEARLFKEAYVLCRTRYMDSIAEQALQEWAHSCVISGAWNMAAVCYLASGNLSQVAAVLGKSSDEESLSLAADIAKVIGQSTYAGHIEEKREQIISKKKQAENKEEELEKLPSRVELVINDEEVKYDVDKNEGNIEEVPQEKSDAELIEKLLGSLKEESDATGNSLKELPAKMKNLMNDGSGDCLKNGGSEHDTVQQNGSSNVIYGNGDFQVN